MPRARKRRRLESPWDVDHGAPKLLKVYAHDELDRSLIKRAMHLKSVEGISFNGEIYVPQKNLLLVAGAVAWLRKKVYEHFLFPLARGDKCICCGVSCLKWKHTKLLTTSMALDYTHQYWCNHHDCDLICNNIYCEFETDLNNAKSLPRYRELQLRLFPQLGFIHSLFELVFEYSMHMVFEKIRSLTKYVTMPSPPASPDHDSEDEDE